MVVFPQSNRANVCVDERMQRKNECIAREKLSAKGVSKIVRHWIARV